MESNYYQAPLPFIGTFRIFSAQKCCQNLTFLFRGNVGHSTLSGISTFCSIILNGILGKMNNLHRENNSCKTLTNIFLLHELP